MKIFDINDIDGSIKNVVDICTELEETKDYSKALNVCLVLSTMKLIIGVEKFNDLPAFCRWLDMSEKVIKANENKENI